jgi:hypothetical protein
MGFGWISDECDDIQLDTPMSLLLIGLVKRKFINSFHPNSISFWSANIFEQNNVTYTYNVIPNLDRISTT